MHVRAAFLAVTAAALLPLTGTSHASCLDDLQANAQAGYSASPKSQYWSLGHVEHSGTADLAVHGDALVADWTSYAGDQARKAQIIVGNAPDSATTFVDCVAG